MKKNYVLTLLVFTAFVLGTSFAYAQRTVSGTITDENGQGLPGVSVVVKGTTTGTTADLDGKYSLSTPNGATLVYSYVSYISQEVSVGTRSIIDLQMQPDVTQLEELVVIGYGAVKKSDLTGAVVAIGKEDFNKGINVAPDQLIRGKVTGVQVTQNSGQPGAASTINIRGNSSIRAGNNPLFVIDGFALSGNSSRPGSIDIVGGNTPGANPLNYINPADIESITILKDASGAGIYGSRAANGVVLINTKRGLSGTPRIEFGAYVGVGSTLRTIDVLDAAQYRAALNQYDIAITDNSDGGANVDPFGEITRTAITSNYNLSISGGTENSSYRISLGYLDQEGILLESRLKKYTSNISASHGFLDDRLRIDYNLFATHTTEILPPNSNNADFTGDIIAQALQWNPTQPLRNDDGSLNILTGSTTINPVAALAAYEDQANITTVLGSISPSFKIIDGLDLKFFYGINHSVGVRETSTLGFINIQNVEDRGVAFYGNNSLTTQQATTTLNFNKALTSTINLNAIVGYEYISFANRGIGMQGRDFPSDIRSSLVPFLRGTTTSTRDISSFQEPDAQLSSTFARAIVNIDEKYIITGTVRYDGSTRLSSGNQFGLFPSVAAAWNIHKSLPLNIFDELKLRLGWGQLGNQEFPAGRSQANFSLDDGQAASRQTFANPSLVWETTTTLNAGVDFALFNSRLYGSVEWFNKTTTDLLYPSIVAFGPGDGRLWENLENAEVNNTGIEILLNGVVIDKNDITWNLGVNATFISNKFTRSTEEPLITGGLFGQGISGTFIQRFEDGQPLHSFFLRQYEGLNSDGVATFANEGTLALSGDPNPSLLLGINTSLRYKDLDFSANLYGAFGHQIYNNTANTVLPIGNLGTRNIAANLLGGSVQESTANPVAASTRYLENGDFLKAANLTVGYNIGDIGGVVRNTRVYFTGQNLFLITNYSGFDPEVNTVNSGAGDVPSLGIEYTAYPTPRTFIFGVSASF